MRSEQARVSLTGLGTRQAPLAHLEFFGPEECPQVSATPQPGKGPPGEAHELPRLWPVSATWPLCGPS